METKSQYGFGEGWAIDSVHHLDENAGEWENHAILRMVHNSRGETEGHRYFLIPKKLVGDPRLRNTSNDIFSYGRHYVFDQKLLRELAEKATIPGGAIEVSVVNHENMLLLFERRREFEENVASDIEASFKDAQGRDLQSRVDDGATRSDSDSDELARVTVFDVGQGDLILVDMAGGEQWLIDAWFWKTERYKNFKSYMRRKASANRIDRLVVSHLHYDHIKRAKEVLSDFKLKEVIVNDGLKHRTKTARELLSAAKSAGVLRVLSKPWYMKFGSLEILIVPTTSYLKRNYSKDPNDHELVVMMMGKQSSFFFAGDAPREILCDILMGKFPHREDPIGATKEDLKSFCVEFLSMQEKVLKVSHHCSRTGTDDKLLRLLGPVSAVTSCSSNNKYQHPHDPPKAKIDRKCNQGGGEHSLTCQEIGDIEFVVT